MTAATPTRSASTDNRLAGKKNGQPRGVPRYPCDLIGKPSDQTRLCAALRVG
jgi:hypothetical protein